MPRGRKRQDGTIVVKGPNYGSPLQAIRTNCKNCVGGSAHEVNLCPCDDCALWPFRHGRGPDVARADGLKVDPPKEKTK